MGKRLHSKRLRSIAMLPTLLTLGNLLCGFAAIHFVQEGMLNAVSHGKATAIRVAFREAQGMLMVSVKDNGAGAKAVQEGIGIAGMRERIERLGGSLEYGSSRNGFSIEMRLPLVRAATEAAQERL